jgi:hypothetical protein
MIAVTAVRYSGWGIVLCAPLGVISDKVTEGGGHPDAIAALVLLATRYPVAERQPRSQDAPGCAPGSPKGDGR